MKKLLCVLLSLMMILGIAGAAAETNETETITVEMEWEGRLWECEYSLLEDGTICIVWFSSPGWWDTAIDHFVCPAEVDGYTVSAIDLYAFAVSRELKTFTIPDSVVSVKGNPVCSGCVGSVVVSPQHPALSVVDGVLFDKDQKRLIAYPGSREESGYTIPDGVTSIGDWAFYQCYELTAVQIPEGVVSVGDYAFSECTSLESIILPQSLVELGEGVFVDNSQMQSVVLPEGLTMIPADAFEGCCSLSAIDIPDNVTTIGEGAFYGCRQLDHVVVPEKVETIGECAFWECDNLSSVTILSRRASFTDKSFGCVNYDSNIRTWFFTCTEKLTLRVWRGSVAEADAMSFYIPFEYMEE